MDLLRSEWNKRETRGNVKNSKKKKKMNSNEIVANESKMRKKRYKVTKSDHVS